MAASGPRTLPSQPRRTKGLAVRLQYFPSPQPAVALLARGSWQSCWRWSAAGLVLAVAGANPIQLSLKVIQSTFGSSFAGLQDVSLLVTPLILTGLAVAVALKVGAWNIGAEGQFYALGPLPHNQHRAAIPWSYGCDFAADVRRRCTLRRSLDLDPDARARLYAGVSELITTLLLNFVGTLCIAYYASRPGRGSKSRRPCAPEPPRAFRHNVPSEISLGTKRSLGISAGDHGADAAGRRRPEFYPRWGYEVSALRARTRRPHFMRASRFVAISSSVMLLFMARSRASRGMSPDRRQLAGNRASAAGAASPTISAILASWSRCWRAARRSGVLARRGPDGGDPQFRNHPADARGEHLDEVLAITGLILFFTAIGDELAHYRIVPIEKAEMTTKE